MKIAAEVDVGVGAAEVEGSSAGLALSTIRSEVCDVGAKLEYERTLHT